MTLLAPRLLRSLALRLLALTPLIGAATGCLDRPVGKPAPETNSLIVDRISQSGVDKIDLLFMVDNSVSMADKQQILQAAVPDLVGRLVNPVCVDAMGNQYPTETAALDSREACPTVNGLKLEREFDAIVDINIGVITSSLDGFGSTTGACDNVHGETEQKEDLAHLVGSLPRGQLALNGNPAANSAGFGFLEWRDGDRQSLETAFSRLIQATGEFGCGYEASLEAWYRFLIDPEPYAELLPAPCSPGGSDLNCRAPSGIDQEILDQRAAFLRHDSLVAIVMLTDENDCSVKASGQAWYVTQVGNAHAMWRAASICETEPNDACCYSCGQAPPGRCAPDPICGDATNTRETGDYYFDDQNRKSIEDQDNLRCFHQKQRFGVDFLYPTQRYSNALAQRELCLTRNDLSAANCGTGRLVPNPLYNIPAGATSTLTRDSNLVFLAGIIGVPWQDIARSTDTTDPLEYKTFAELEAENVWPTILGDGVNPVDKLMVESIEPRTGNSPALDEPLAPPSADHLANTINGHEWQPNPPSDLQYACIFPLVEPRDCAALRAGDDPRHCDCDGTADTATGQQSKPLCQDPDGAYGNTQYYAKAYPGIRELQVLKEYGSLTTNSIVASICARNVQDRTAQDYGYRPAIDTSVISLKGRFCERCLPRPLALDSEGNVPCNIIEARRKDFVNEACQTCGAMPARDEVDPQALPQLHERMQQNGLCREGDCTTNYCLCEVLPTRRSGTEADDPPNPDAEHDCQNNEVPADSTDGWCYVDVTGDLTIGSEALVEKCPAAAKRTLRFVGDGRLASNSTTFVACLGASFIEGSSDEMPH